MDATKIAAELAAGPSASSSIDKLTGHKVVSFFGYDDCVELVSEKARVLLVGVWCLSCAAVVPLPYAALAWRRSADSARRLPRAVLRADRRPELHPPR